MNSVSSLLNSVPGEYQNYSNELQIVQSYKFGNFDTNNNRKYIPGVPDFGYYDSSTSKYRWYIDGTYETTSTANVTIPVGTGYELVGTKIRLTGITNVPVKTSSGSYDTGTFRNKYILTKCVTPSWSTSKDYVYTAEASCDDPSTPPILIYMESYFPEAAYADSGWYRFGTFYGSADYGKVFVTAYCVTNNVYRPGKINAGSRNVGSDRAVWFHTDVEYGNSQNVVRVSFPGYPKIVSVSASTSNAPYQEGYSNSSGAGYLFYSNDSKKYSLSYTSIVSGSSYTYIGLVIPRIVSSDIITYDFPIQTAKQPGTAHIIALM